MGNSKFRLSEMIPSAWFSKLRDMDRERNHHHHKNPPCKPKKKQPPTTTKHHHHHHSLPRKSYYFTRDLHPDQNFQDHSQPHSHFPHDPPRNIPSKQDPKPVHYSFAHAIPVPDDVTSNAATTTAQPQPLPTQEFRLDRLLVTEPLPLDKTTLCSFSSSSTCSYGVNSISGSDTVIHVDPHSFDKEPKKPLPPRDSFSQLSLPPILTKPKSKHRNSSAKQEKSNISAKEQHRPGPRRRSSANYPHSPGVKLKTKSPRLLAKKKLGDHARKSSPAPAAAPNLTRFGNSFAVVKSSSDPASDFRESMVEMIVENNIKASKDLEELLTCYLSLNSDEYHQVIVDVFKQIWFDLSEMSGWKQLTNY